MQPGNAACSRPRSASAWLISSLLKAIFPLTKVVDKLHPLPDVFDVARIYTCSILIVITATLLCSYAECQQ
jgi:hypothetical protein